LTVSYSDNVLAAGLETAPMIYLTLSRIVISQLYGCEDNANAGSLCSGVDDG
jgi:hypothetical protein